MELNKIPENLCEGVVKVAEKTPIKNYLRIDLKDGFAINQEGKKEHLEFTKNLHKWFIEELKKLGVSDEKIIRAELEIELSRVACTLEVNDKVYHHTKAIVSDLL